MEDLDVIDVVPGLVDHNVGELQPAAWPQDAVDLIEHRVGVWTGRHPSEITTSTEASASGSSSDGPVRALRRSPGRSLRRPRACARASLRSCLGPDRPPVWAGHLRGDQQAGTSAADRMLQHDLPGLDQPERPVVGDTSEALEASRRRARGTAGARGHRTRLNPGLIHAACNGPALLPASRPPGLI